jgi:hypothetical protein
MKESGTTKLFYIIEQSHTKTKKKNLNSVALVHKRTIPTERPRLVGEISANFEGRGCHVVSATAPRSRYFSIQVVPQL